MEGVEEIEGYSSEQVEEEPAPHVVDGDELRVVRHLAALTHIGRAEVEYYVWNKTMVLFHVLRFNANSAVRVRLHWTVHVRPTANTNKIMSLGSVHTELLTMALALAMQKIGRMPILSNVHWRLRCH